MATRNKSQRARVREGSIPAPVAAPSAWDVWLSRASHIAQFGLFLLTAGTIYFTVIPLYQKALLDEQIARRELELKKVQERLDLAYVRIREFAVRTYIFHAGAECSGLLLSNDESQQASDFPERVLAIAPKECLESGLRSAALTELRREDLETLRSEVLRIGAELEVARQEALVRLAAAEEDVSKVPIGPPEGHLVSRLAEQLVVGESSAARTRLLAQIAIVERRSSISQNYGDALRSKVSSLGGITWPETSAVDN